MSREIKFRAWHDRHMDQIVTGYMMQLPESNGIRSYAGYRTTERPINVSESWPEDQNSNTGTHEFSVADAKIMQYTGFKDKNGKEIYEGDVVEYVQVISNPENKITRDIVTLERFPVYWLEDEEFGYEGEFLVDPESTNVIGNIYENPELLR